MYSNFQNFRRVIRPLIGAHVAHRITRCDENDESIFNLSDSFGEVVDGTRKRLPRVKISLNGTSVPSGNEVASGRQHDERLMMRSRAKVHGDKLWPVYNLEEVRAMADQNIDMPSEESPRERIVVSYSDGVFDVTHFECKHPGGQDLIRGASGGSLEHFWSLYQVHYKPSVQNILEKYRVGVLHPDDRVKITDLEDPYINEPDRDPSLIVLQEKPYFDETPLAKLADSYYTPNSLLKKLLSNGCSKVDFSLRLPKMFSKIKNLNLFLESSKTLILYSLGYTYEIISPPRLLRQMKHWRMKLKSAFLPS